MTIPGIGPIGATALAASVTDRLRIISNTSVILRAPLRLSGPGDRSPVERVILDALEVERWNRLHPDQTPRTTYIERALEGHDGPIVAASDYMKLVPDQIARWVPNRYITLGTDGFGMSDTREALREHFEVDARFIVAAALHGLAQEGAITAKAAAKGIADLGIDADKLRPTTV